MAWLADGVFYQGDDEPLSLLPVEARPGPALIVHLVNPYLSPAGSRDEAVQALSYETVRRARRLCPGPAVELAVELAGVVAAGEEDSLPEGFASAGILERTVADLQAFQHPRPLPLLFDILDLGCSYARRRAAAEGLEAEQVFVIFTNADICVMPQFYGAVAALIERGFETLTINRRSIPEYPPRIDLLPSMYAEYGADHTGFDCFVFPLAHYPRFVRSDACVGRDFVMRSLLYNLVATARRMAMLRKAHLTFHLGGIGEWSDPKYADYRRFNVAQAKRALMNLMQRDRATARRLAQFCTRHKEPFTFRHDPAAGAGDAPEAV